MVNASLPVLPALPLEVLLYTSFNRVGFTLLTSRGVPKQISQAFLSRIVQQHWDAYHPLPYKDRAAYLYQLSHQHVIFGWLYPDGQDEFGRANVPYFIAHYLAAPMSAELLMALWICIKKGPIVYPERNGDVPSSSLEPLIIQDVHQYIPTRPGAAIAPQVWEQSYQRLKTKDLITLFSVHDERDAAFTPALPSAEPFVEPQHPPLTPPVPLELPPMTNITPFPVNQNSVVPVSVPPLPTPVPVENTVTMLQESSVNLDPSSILQELMSKPIDIQGAVLVSAEGQPITMPVGLSEHSASMLAGAMLYLAHQTREELQWQISETVLVRGPEGCTLLCHCHGEVYLLVKAGKVPMGLLEGEVNRTVTRLRSAMTTPTPAPSLPALPQMAPDKPSALESVTILQEIPRDISSLEPTPVAEKDPPTLLIQDSEITYRGRRASS
jgi:predicted regulator of Ras-like GTPase activity (Roadblock/LC7/MglB family)